MERLQSPALLGEISLSVLLPIDEDHTCVETPSPSLNSTNYAPAIQVCVMRSSIGSEDFSFYLPSTTTRLPFIPSQSGAPFCESKSSELNDDIGTCARKYFEFGAQASKCQGLEALFGLDTDCQPTNISLSMLRRPWDDDNLRLASNHQAQSALMRVEKQFGERVVLRLSRLPDDCITASLEVDHNVAQSTPSNTHPEDCRFVDCHEPRVISLSSLIR